MRLTCCSAVLLILVAACTLTGCTRPEERSADGRIIIDYWEKWTGFEKDAMQQIVDAYNDSQERVFVRFISTSQIDRKLLLATAGGNPPDIAGFWSHSVVNYADKGALLPLDGLMERDGISVEDYVPSVIDCTRFRGFTWGLPSTPATIALHYNKGMMRRAGLDPEHPPATLDEMDAMAGPLTHRGEDDRYAEMAFVPTDPGWWGPMWPYFFGADLVNDDGTELLCASDESVRAFEWVQHWAEDFGRKDVRVFEAASRGEFASASNPFMKERIAMMLQGVWMANFIETFGPDVEWAAAAFPVSEPGMDPCTVVECDMLVIPRGARHVDEAWSFIKYVQEQKNMERLCIDQKKFSPLTDVSDEFYATHANPYIRLFRELAESSNARAVPKVPIWTEYRDELGVAIDQIWVQGADPREALERVKRRIQPKLDRANRRWEKVRSQRIEEWNKL